MGISIILSSFRRSHLLERSLYSIQRQGVNDLEVVVVNDGVEDSTEAVVNQYRAKLDIKYLFTGHRNNDGDKWRASGFALNTGVKRCKYDKIILSCAEIYHLNDAIMPIAEVLAVDEYALATPNFIYFDSDGKFLDNIRHTENTDCMVIDRGATDGRLMPFFMGMWKERFMEIGGYDEDFTGYACDDNDLMDRLVGNGCRYVTTNSKVVHLYHGKRCDSQIHWENPAWAYNYRLYQERKGIIVRNQNKNWGEIC